MRKAGFADSGTVRVTGYTNREMFDRYNTGDNEDLRKAVAQMGAFLANVDQVLSLSLFSRLKQK
jgi:hypothetical protein